MKKREKLFDEILQKSKYHIVFKSAKEIDDLGISFCIKKSILEIMQTLENYASSFLMDGNTNFGIENLQKEFAVFFLFWDDFRKIQGLLLRSYPIRRQWICPCI